MNDFEMSGEADFYRLSKALKAAGRTKLRSKLRRKMIEAGQPMIDVVHEAARQELPKRGGLNETVAARKINVSPRTGRDPGIKLVMPKTQPGYLFGDIRRPVFEKDKSTRQARKGTPEETKWVEQHIGPGEWFDDTIVRRSDLVRDRIEQGVQDIVDEIVRGGGA